MIRTEDEVRFLTHILEEPRVPSYGLAGDCLQQFEGFGVEGEGLGSAAAAF